MSGSVPSPASSLAAKLNALIDERWSGESKAPGNAAIARLVREQTGLSISTGYLWMLRTGRRDNPTGPRLQALARFFRKPPAFFLDESATSEDFELAAALRKKDVRLIALRSDGLSVKSKQAILEMIERAREIERLDSDEPESLRESE